MIPRLQNKYKTKLQTSYKNPKTNKGDAEFNKTHQDVGHGRRHNMKLSLYLYYVKTFPLVLVVLVTHP